MKKIFYLFRHGQTDMNAAKRWQGAGVDFPLNEEGRRQAGALAETMKDMGVEAIYTSPLTRARQTADIVADALNVPVFVRPALIEGRFGVAEGRTRDEISALFLDILPRWENLDDKDFDVRFPDGESRREIQCRILNDLREIAETEPYRRVGISGHSATIRCVLFAFGIKRMFIPHGEPFKLEFSGKDMFRPV